MHDVKHLLSRVPIAWPVALRLGRVSNLPTVWTNALAGVVLSGASPRLATVAGLTGALSLFYVAGMYLNDAFDAGFDRAHRPGRPIPAGDATTGAVFAGGAGLMAAGLAILLGLGFAPGGTGLRGLALGLALAAAILIYDLWHKGNPVGPVLMGLCRVLAYLTAAAAAAASFGAALVPLCLVALSYLVGLTYAAKQEDLARPGNLWPLLFLFAPFVWTLPAALVSPVGLALYGLLAAAVGVALRLLLRHGKRRIGDAVGLLIAGISLLDGLFVAGAGRPALAALTVAAFALTLLAQRRIAGT